MYLLSILMFSMCKHPRHLTSVTSFQKHNTRVPIPPLIWIPCAPILPQVYRSLIKCFLRKMLIFSYKCSIIIVRLNIKHYKIVCINLIWLKFILFNDLNRWLHHQIIKYLKTIIRDKNVLNIHMIKIINCVSKYVLYKNAHNRTVFIIFDVIMFLNIRCANFTASPLTNIIENVLLTKIRKKLKPYCILLFMVSSLFSNCQSFDTLPSFFLAL